MKIYKQKDLKSYFKEKEVLNKLDDHFVKKVDEDSQGDEVTGFPSIVSKLENNRKAEILMEALGPNLRKLVKQCPGK